MPSPLKGVARTDPHAPGAEPQGLTGHPLLSSKSWSWGAPPDSAVEMENNW